MKVTMYEIMSVLRFMGAWRFCRAIFPRFETLVLYYNVYRVYKTKITTKKRGYLVDLMRDTDILSLLQHDRFGAVKWGTDDLRWAIREMEREYYI